LSRIVTLHNFEVTGDDPSSLRMSINASTYRYKGAEQ
jgi:Tfp pilus assembly protein PilO